jgi:hypothetical protein
MPWHLFVALAVGSELRVAERLPEAFLKAPFVSLEASVNDNFLPCRVTPFVDGHL